MLDTAHSLKTPLQYLSSKPDQLTHQHLLSLASGETQVIHIPRFIDPDICSSLAKRAQGLGYSPYINVPSAHRIGMAYYETEGDPVRVERYFAEARQHIADFRRACAPFTSPIDTLRCTLDEVWPAGAQLQTLLGRKMFIGLSRMVEPGTTFLAHHDIFEDDAPGCAEATGLVAQFGANVYLQMPDSGGSLLMWDKEFSSSEFNLLRGADYGIAIEALGEPALVVTPAPGDLLIFNSRKLHAVSSGAGNSRLTVSCFVGYRGPSKPLTFWS